MAAVAEHVPAAAVLSLSGEMGTLVTQLLTTMSAHKPDQASALEEFFAMLNAEPEAVTVHLSSFLSATSTDDNRRIAAAARILCGLVVPDWSFTPHWTQLPDKVRDEVYSGLKSALEVDPSKIIVKLATVLHAWPHVLPLLLRAGSLAHGNREEHKMVLLVLARLPPFQDLSDSLSTIRGLLSVHMDHSSSADLRVHAMGAAVNMIKCLRANVDKSKMLPLLPLMAKPLEDCLHSELETSAQEALQLLLELARAAPSTLRPHMASVEPAVRKIAVARHLPLGTRRLATYFLTHCAKAAGIVIKVESALQRTSDMAGFVSRVAILLMDMLLEVNDEVALPMVQSEDEISGLAQHCLNRLANAIGGNTLMLVAMDWLRSRQATTDWKQRYATLISIIELAEGCANDMIRHLDAIIPMITSGFEQTHPIVHWVTIDAVACVYSNLGLEMPHSNDVLLLLVRSMNVWLHDRHLKEHAAQAVLEIIKKGDPETLEPIIGEVLNCLQLMRKAEEVPLVVAPLSPSSTVAARPSLLTAAHETVVVHLAQGIEQTQAATPKTGNQQQADEPVSKEALIEFLKAFSNGGVTSTTSLTCIVGYQLSIEAFPVPWMILLKFCLFVGIPFSLATAGVAHAVGHHPGWLDVASTMVLFEGFYTVVLGGGLVGLARTSGTITSVASALTLGALVIVWSCIFSHPKWVKNPKEWMHYPIVHSGQPQEAGLLKSIGEVWQRIKGQDNREPEPRGGWLSKFRQIFRRHPAGQQVNQTVV